MPKYVLHYFNARGRAELIRLVLKAAGQEFEDIRYDRETEWPQAKDKMPMGQIPVLYIDGEPLCQSNAIVRYLAGEYGLYGNDSMERARIDEVYEQTNDVLLDMILTHIEKDETRKAEKKKELIEKFPVHFGKLEKLLTRNDGGDGFFVGDKLSIADLHAVNMLGWLPTTELLEKFPKLLALKERVDAVPNIKEWLQTRPETQF